MIVYSIDDLTTIDQCDAILAMVSPDKADQDYRKRALEKKHSVAIKESPSLENDLIVAQQNIAAIENTIAQLPEGDLKKDWQSKLSKAILDQEALKKTRDNYGLLRMLKYECNSNSLEKSLNEIDVFIAAVNAKKATL